MVAPADPDDYRTRSLWLEGLPGELEPRPGLKGDRDCDVAIVGAGFTGLWSAYYLKRLQPDLRVSVIEREIAGYGPSGRNGGFVLGGLVGPAAAFGLRGAALAHAVAVTNVAVDEIGEVARREAIDCGYLKAGALTVATSQPQWQRLQSAPGDGQLLSAAETEARVAVPGVYGGRFTPLAARIDPARLVRGLADACERLGVTIYEQTAALSIEPGSVRCATGSVRAETVVRATESYTTELPGQRLRYLPLYSLMIATEPLGESMWQELRWPDGLLIDDVHYLFFYAQRTTDGRIAIGGRGAPYRLRSPIDPSNERNERVRERLIRSLKRAFPAAAQARVTHHWGGPLAAPRDWSMSVNYDRGQGLVTAGGYTGHGVAAANLSGRTVADLILGRDSDLVTMPWVGHKSRRWEPEPLRYLASQAIITTLGSADRREDATGRRARRVIAIRPFLPPRH
ncbi:MAG TPA: FAD-dependent oxidoreductase [Solirubrobacteraceae bacterium]|nr:FAD-dependent oxidoreductase [Solirubrobacteraceae bacterium]